MWDPNDVHETFTPRPRNLDQMILPYVLHGGGATPARVEIVSILTSETLLSSQARKPIGEYLWVNEVAPLL